MSPDSDLCKLLQVYSYAHDNKDENLMALVDEALDFGLEGSSTKEESLIYCLAKFEELINSTEIKKD